MKIRLLSSRFNHALRMAMGAFMATSLFAADMQPEQRAFFESKIRPVLVKHCYECHSVGAKKIGGKLLLDSPGEMIEGGESGPAVIPGKPDECTIIQALRYDGLEMPPKHRLPESVVNDFVTWVKMGAPDPRENAPMMTKSAAPDKAALWSFQPMTNPKLPSIKAKEWPRDAIDAFVLEKIEASGLSPMKDATPAVLVRRLYFDLIGLPPSADEVEAFVADFAKHGRLAVEPLVDSLLGSPHFGERWGRHWLDVARFGESNGNDGLSRNPSFPHAWRYRDYVIQAFNEDVPYDRFITEQIAGDLLPADSPEQRDRQLIATGFLAIGSKPAKAMNDNFDMDVVADQISVVGSGIMGLSVGCARCHDHKHDPIPTRDYYALAGIFKSTETLWGGAGYEALTAPQTPLHELEAAPKVMPPSEVAQVGPVKPSAKKPAKPAFPYPPGTPLAMGVREAKAIADCKINIDGESKKLGPAVPRGFLTACIARGPAIEVKPQQSGRLELARWLTSGGHPQTARVMVNRIWQHLLGHGLVRTPDDFGVYGDRPSHPELLDHLATRFGKDGWSIKRLIRSIVLSRTYQLGSECDERTRAADPNNTLLARHTRRRLDAEALRDAMLVASGDLDDRPGQGSIIRHRDLLVNQTGNLHQPSSHRSVYLLMLRNSMPPELTAFNLPDGIAVTGKRDVTTLPTQALYLLNSPFLVDQSKHLAARVLSSSDSDAGLIRAAYRHAFTREPSEMEIQRSIKFLRETDAALASGKLSDGIRRQTVWAAFCQVLLASNELRYLD